MIVLFYATVTCVCLLLLGAYARLHADFSVVYAISTDILHGDCDDTFAVKRRLSKKCGSKALILADVVPTRDFFTWVRRHFPDIQYTLTHMVINGDAVYILQSRWVAIYLLKYLWFIPLVWLPTVHARKALVAGPTSTHVVTSAFIVYVGNQREGKIIGVNAGGFSQEIISNAREGGAEVQYMRPSFARKILISVNGAHEEVNNIRSLQLFPWAFSFFTMADGLPSSRIIQKYSTAGFFAESNAEFARNILSILNLTIKDVFVTFSSGNKNELHHFLGEFQNSSCMSWAKHNLTLSELHTFKSNVQDRVVFAFALNGGHCPWKNAETTFVLPPFSDLRRILDITDTDLFSHMALSLGSLLSKTHDQEDIENALKHSVLYDVYGDCWIDDPTMSAEDIRKEIQDFVDVKYYPHLDAEHTCKRY